MILWVVSGRKFEFPEDQCGAFENDQNSFRKNIWWVIKIEN